MLVLFLILLYGSFFTAIAIALNVKFDWTEEKELILWYTITDEFTGSKERKFIKLLKL